MKRIISLLLLAMVTVVLFSCGEKIPQKEPTNSDYNSNSPVSADDSLPEEFTMSILDTGYKVIERDKRYSVGVFYTYEALQEYVDRVIYGFDLFAEQTVLRNPSPERLRGFMPALNELMDQILLIQSFDEAFFEKNDLVLVTADLAATNNTIEMTDATYNNGILTLDLCELRYPGGDSITCRTAIITVSKERNVTQDTIEIRFTSRNG